jgi:sugar lactone lactonase YvrE
VASRKELRKLKGFGRVLLSMVFSPDGKTFACAGRWKEEWDPRDGHIYLWDVATGKEIRRIEVDPGSGASGLVFSPDSKILLAINGKGDFDLWETQSGKLRQTLKHADGPMDGAAFSPDGKLIAATRVHFPGYQAQVTVWDLATGTPRNKFSVGKGRTTPCQFLDSRNLVTINCGDRSLMSVWDSETGTLQQEITLPGYVYAVAFSPDQKSFLWTDSVNLHLWELTTGKECGRLGAQRGVMSFHGAQPLAFAPDGRTAATAGIDVLLWDLTGHQQKDKDRLCQDTKQLSCRWGDLAGEDPVRARSAVWDMVYATGSVAILKEKLRPVKAADETRVKRLLTDLDSEAFTTREKAEQELESFGEAVVPDLNKALGNTDSQEVSRRVKKLLEAIAQKPITQDRVRELRAVEVLEQIGTAEARLVLEILAEGIPTSQLTREARASLKRIEQRQPRSN